MQDPRQAQAFGLVYAVIHGFRMPLFFQLTAAVAAIAFRQARRTIRISQMDFAISFEGVNYWQADVVAAIADVLAPTTSISISSKSSAILSNRSRSPPTSCGTTGLRSGRIPLARVWMSHDHPGGRGR